MTISPSGPAQAGPRTALVVEDNQDLCDLFAGFVEELGFTVTSCYSAGAALAALSANRFDLLMADINLLDPIDGIALANDATARWPGIRIVLTSAYRDALERARGLYPVLSKPFDFEDLKRLALD